MSVSDRSAELRRAVLTEMPELVMALFDQRSVSFKRPQEGPPPTQFRAVQNYIITVYSISTNGWVPQWLACKGLVSVSSNGGNRGMHCLWTFVWLWNLLWEGANCVTAKSQHTVTMLEKLTELVDIRWLVGQCDLTATSLHQHTLDMFLKISHCQDIFSVLLKSKKRFQRMTPCQDFFFLSNLTHFPKKS